MKRIALTGDEGTSVKNVIKAVMETPPPGGGITPAEMRKRIRVLDALDEADEADELTLEDADWSYLNKATQAFQFAKADGNLLKSIDEIIEAETVKPPKDKAKAGEVVE